MKQRGANDITVINAENDPIPFFFSCQTICASSFSAKTVPSPPLKPSAGAGSVSRDRAASRRSQRDCSRDTSGRVSVGRRCGNARAFLPRFHLVSEDQGETSEGKRSARSHCQDGAPELLLPSKLAILPLERPLNACVFLSTGPFFLPLIHLPQFQNPSSSLSDSFNKFPPPPPTPPSPPLFTLRPPPN